jgi:hypothetical protein
MMLAIFTRTARLLLVMACLGASLWAGPALASFHLYAIAEIYSNADGTVQYVRLSTTQPGQNFLAGMVFTSTSGGTTNTFHFANSLNTSTNTANTSVLIATQGFANLNIVTPDYLIPSGFLNVNGGTINYAGVNSVSYTALPTDGVHSINSLGVSQTNSPANFSGATGTIAATFTPQAGFWYNPAEGGRGYVIEIHGNNLFIGGFMYDANGNAIWYASGPAPMTSSTTYTNMWQQYGGGQTLTGAFKISGVVNANVGSLTIQFTSATAGTLTMPNSVQIPITRFPF